MSDNDIFIKSINTKSLVTVEFNLVGKGIISRKCVPYDYGPSRKFKDGLDRFYFYDLEITGKNHDLFINPNEVINMEMLTENFDPAKYVDSKHKKWHIKRDWGELS